MPMTYEQAAIPDQSIPRAQDRRLQHLLDTYASETNKVHSVWSSFSAAHLDFRPHPRSSSVGEILKHQLLSERRFFGEFLGTPEPPAQDVLPSTLSIPAYAERLVELAQMRLGLLADRPPEWWFEEVPFFDVRRERIWVFWRRILHTSHHRAQLTVYQRLLDRPVLSTYGPTADVTWEGADPTTTVEAAARSGSAPGGA